MAKLVWGDTARVAGDEAKGDVDERAATLARGSDFEFCVYEVSMGY